MADPHPFSLAWYAGLPASWRGLDTEGDALGFVRGLGDVVGPTVDLVDRIDRRYPGDPGYDPAVDETSDLVDPQTAAAEWLAWVAQLYGVRLDRAGGPVSFAGTYGQLSIDFPTYALLDAGFGTYADMAAGTTPDLGLAVQQQRDLIENRPGWLAGSTGSIRDLIGPSLTGSRRVDFVRNDGHWAAVKVITYTPETPEPWKVQYVLDQEGVAPAGDRLTAVLMTGGSYALVDAAVGTYANQAAKWPTYGAMTSWVPGT